MASIKVCVLKHGESFDSWTSSAVNMRAELLPLASLTSLDETRWHLANLTISSRTIVTSQLIKRRLRQTFLSSSWFKLDWADAGEPRKLDENLRASFCDGSVLLYKPAKARKTINKPLVNAVEEDIVERILNGCFVQQDSLAPVSDTGDGLVRSVMPSAQVRSLLRTNESLRRSIRGVMQRNESLMQINRSWERTNLSLMQSVRSLLQTNRGVMQRSESLMETNQSWERTNAILMQSIQRLTRANQLWEQANWEQTKQSLVQYFYDDVDGFKEVATAQARRVRRSRCHSCL